MSDSAFPIQTKGVLFGEPFGILTERHLRIRNALSDMTVSDMTVSDMTVSYILYVCRLCR